MSEGQKEVTLKSGRKLVLKRPGVLERFYMHDDLPDITLDAATIQKIRNATPEEQRKIAAELAEKQPARDILKQGIRAVCVCVCKPRFWADLRESTERLQRPLKCPDGMVEFDLSTDEMNETLGYIEEFKKEEVEAADPL